MGLCKCEKRCVTALFCFEHRVNVCEKCLLEKHQTCVVQSYLEWLSNSEFENFCILCNYPFTDRETIRLKCLHLFHKDCLHSKQVSMSEETKTENRKCPRCLDKIFPVNNQTSPTIEVLKKWLLSTNWGRNGFGLPSDPTINDFAISKPPPVEAPVPRKKSIGSQERKPSSTVIEMDSSMPTIHETFQNITQERNFASRNKQSDNIPWQYEKNSSKLLTSDDNESKYKKRSVVSRFRYLQFRTIRKPLTIIIVFTFIVYILYSIFSRAMSDSSPLADHEVARNE
uniref:Zinc finger protein-like 1 homolog n=1 Tax=Rhabditophanes sp. KR3021 TaxID=114890 RepID=A0AC35TNF3_9BILA